jgi:hypothetical protein
MNPRAFLLRPPISGLRGSSYGRTAPLLAPTSARSQRQSQELI